MWSSRSPFRSGGFFGRIPGVQVGKAVVAESFFHANDWTHTTPEGAQQNALRVVEGLRGNGDRRLLPLLRALPDEKLDQKP